LIWLLDVAVADKPVGAAEIVMALACEELPLVPPELTACTT
jgi:hypothetical protein